MTTTEEAAGYRAQTLTRGLSVLRAIADAREPITLSDIHTATEIPKPTLVRLLAILTQEGCTVRLDDRPTYGLGPTIASIAAGVGADLSIEDLARPHLARLSEDLGHTANLGVLSGGQVLHACVVLSDRPIRFVVRSGARDSLHCTGLGKALLTGLPPSALNTLVTPESLTPRTSHTLRSIRQLKADISASRLRGFAYDDQEGAEGLACFAVPVMIDGATVAAISVSGPAAELPLEASGSIIPRITATAEAINGDVRLRTALTAVAPKF